MSLVDSAKHFAKGHGTRFQENVKWRAFVWQYHLPQSLVRFPGWSMDPRDFKAIFEVARQYHASERLSVVELGSGVSTVILANVLSQTLQDIEIHIISVDGEESYAQQAQEMLRQFKLDHYATVNWVQYTQTDDHVWFSKPELEQVIRKLRIDILIVDAPPGILSRCARQPAIPFFLPYLNSHARVMLHDARRLDESLIVSDWRAYFHSCYQIKTPRGFAIFEGPKQQRVNPIPDKRH